MGRTGRKKRTLQRRGDATGRVRKQPLAKGRKGTTPAGRSLRMLEHIGPPDSAAETNGTLLCTRKFTIPQAAKGMGMGTTSLRRIIATGGIPVLKMTGKTLLLESDVEAFIAASRVRVRTVTTPNDQLRPLPDDIANSEHLK